MTTTTAPFEPLILSDALLYELGLFEEREVYRFYVKERRENCTLMEVMNLWLIVPYCFGCALTESFDGIVRPYIRPACWEDDLHSHVGDQVLLEIESNLRRMHFQRKLHAAFSKHIQNRIPSLCELFEAIVDHLLRHRREGIQ